MVRNASRSAGGTTLADTYETVLARGMVEEIEHPSCGPMKLLNSPVKYSRTQPTIRTPPPLLGENTDETLSEYLGLGPVEIQQLRDDKVIL